MALIKYADDISPVQGKRFGFTFQNSRIGASMLEKQKNDRARYPFQKLNIAYLMDLQRSFRDLDPSVVSSWDNWAAAYPQLCKNGVDTLTGRENYIKRNFYRYLNEGIEAPLIFYPPLVEIGPDPLEFSVQRLGDLLFINYMFTNWSSDLEVTFYLSFRRSSGVSYVDSQVRYVGFFPNIPVIVPNYGLLYNHAAAVREPSFINGYHSPTDNDWVQLTEFLGSGNYFAGEYFGYQLKETGYTHWNSPNTAAADSFNLSARGGGLRSYNGNFQDNKLVGHYFSSYVPGIDISRTGIRALNYNFATLTRAFTYRVPGSVNFQYGVSILLIKDNSVNDGSVKIDGHDYPTVKIGDQVWLAEPLSALHYSDGVEIPNIVDNSAWSATVDPACCYYNNVRSNAFSLSPGQLDVTDLYIANFGLLPQTGDSVSYRFLPMSIKTGQFFPEVSGTIICT